MKNQCQHLTEIQRNELLKLLKKSKKLFDETLGNWKIYPVDFKLKEDMKPIFSRSYTVPKLNEEMLKKEVECLVLLGFLEGANDP